MATTVLCARNVFPTAHFLPTAAKSMQKMPPETDGFWTSFTFKRLACYETVKGIDSATDPLPLPLR